MSEELDEVYGQLVTESWKRFEENLHNEQVDDLFVGAVITSMVATGNTLIDLTSDGSAHHLRFQHAQSGERLLFQLRHLTPDPVRSGTLRRCTSGTARRCRTLARCGRR